MNLIKCYLTQSTWYKGAARNGKPVGVLWHDTGAGNTNIKRYVQPSDNDENKSDLLKIIGTNAYKNDWNHTTRQAGVNAFIGKIADGSIATVLTGEFDIHPWGCGGGTKGSCNGKINGKYVEPFWFQFEICDDNYKDEAYFNKVYKEACELTAYICKEYNIDPHGTVEFNGVTVPTILCHADSYKLGLGGNHGDVLTWFKKFNKTMDDVRNDVANILNIDNTFELLDEVKIKSDTTTWANGSKIPTWVKNSNLYVRIIKDNKVTVSIYKEGANTGTVYNTDLELVNKKEEEPTTKSNTLIIDTKEATLEIKEEKIETEEEKTDSVLEIETDFPIEKDDKDVEIELDTIEEEELDKNLDIIYETESNEDTKVTNDNIEESKEENNEKDIETVIENKNIFVIIASLIKGLFSWLFNRDKNNFNK